MDQKEHSKALLNFDNSCIFFYLVGGFWILTCADSLPKIMLSVVMLSIGTVMFYKGHVKDKHLIKD